MAVVTHRQYFQRYQLNVAQYGEILVAEAFEGTKLGDTQRGYDIVTSRASFIDALRRVEIEAETTPQCNLADDIRIQVKSKLSKTISGKASVVHCKETDLRAMTHLAIVLINPGRRISGGYSEQEGLIDNAWLLTRDLAAVLRKKPEKEQYIRVNQLKDADGSNGDILDIKQMLSAIADAKF